MPAARQREDLTSPTGIIHRVNSGGGMLVQA